MGDNDRSLALRRVSIGALTQGMKNILVVGIIIAKHESRKILKKDGTSKWVANMTIRDSADDFINVTGWMSQDFARNLDDDFHIGDVVEIGHPRIDLKSLTANNDPYEPCTQSCFKITFSDDQSTLIKHEADATNAARFLSLLYVPTKPDCQFYTLEELHTRRSKQDIPKNFFVDVLVCVKSVGSIRKFAPKTASDVSQTMTQADQDNQREMRDVVVFDRTQSTTIVKFWDFDWIHLADDWIPMKQILFLADVRVDWDDYRGCPVLTASPKTIITFNPASQEASKLASYAAKTDFSWSGRLDAMIKTVDYRAIRRVTTIVGLQRQLGTDKYRPTRSSQSQFPVASSSDGPITAIIYGFITRLNIDLPVIEFISRRCVCGSVLPRSHPSDSSGCSNPKCDHFSSANPPNVPQFDLRIDIADCTGSISGCRFTHSGVESMLCPINDFLQLTRDRRSEIKSLFVLEPVKIYLMATEPSVEHRSSSVVVLNCQRISCEEMAEKSPLPPIH